MRNSLKIQPPKRGGIYIPDLPEQLRIIGALLKMKHFDGIWCNQGTLTVRRFRDHFEVPEYLSWAEAKRMVDVGEALMDRKPPQSITLRLGPSILVEKQEVG
jgi:hypothetical protein